ncbi:MAG TPA: LapA family protein [Paracoccaceae bacterium]|nr:LapA family protein [Paracoccaceae bacterium]
MIRALRYLVLGALALMLLAVASANRASVTLRLIPEDMDMFLGLGWVMDVPLFVVIFGGVLIGLALGFVWEWVRSASVRGEAVRHRQKVGQLERELTRLKGDAPGAEDDVLALLEAKKT